MSTPARKHDPDFCQAGEECQECKIAQNSKELMRVARERVKKHPPTDAIKRKALELLRGAGPALAPVLALLLLAGCSPGRGYVQADRLTYDAIAVEYLGFVDASALDAEKKSRRHETVRSWAARLEQAEKGGEKGGEK